MKRQEINNKILYINILYNEITSIQWASFDIPNHIFIAIENHIWIYYRYITRYDLYTKDYLFSNQRNRSYIPGIISSKYITKKSV